MLNRGTHSALSTDAAKPILDGNPLNTSVHDRQGEALPRWLSVDQIRKMQRIRRETVVEAMLQGELPFEQRGRIRYARLSDIIAWEERRLRKDKPVVRGLVHPDLAHLAS